jgi:crossover junction endodeoxyribonuclease RuvC
MARMTARQMWAAKLAGKPVPAALAVPRAGLEVPGLGAAPKAREQFRGVVLGIDPSLRGTGLALVEFVAGRGPVLLRCRTVSVPARRTMAEALAEIHRGVTDFMECCAVRHVAMEQTIFVQNIQTAQILGAARGAAMAAAALKGCEVFEYPPLRVKQAVVGAGRASKEQMARTVMGLLGHGRALAFDEADAVGVALCHAFTWR